MKDAYHREIGAERPQQLSYDGYSELRLCRDRFFGLWIAGQLGKDRGAAEAYAADVAAENFDNSGDIYMLHRVRTDLRAAGVHLTMPDLLAQLSKAEITARKEIFQPI